MALSGFAGGGLAGDLQSVMALKMIPCGQPRQQQTRNPNTGRIQPTSGYRGLTPIALSNNGFGLPQTIDAMRLGALDSTFVHEYNHVDRGLSTGGVWSVFTTGLFPLPLLSILATLGVTATSSDDLLTSSPDGTVINTTAATQGTGPLEMCPGGSLSSLRGDDAGGFYAHGAAGALIPNFAVLLVLVALLALNTIRIRRRVLRHLSHRVANPLDDDGPYPALDAYDPRIQARWDTTCALAFTPTLFLTLTMAILPGIAISATLLYLDRMSAISLHEIVEREGYPGGISSRMLDVCEGASTVPWTTPPLDDSVILPPSTTNWNLRSCFTLRASGSSNASGTMVHVDASRFYCKGAEERDDTKTILSSMAGPSVLEMTLIPQTHLLPPDSLNRSASQLRIWFAAQSQIDVNLALSHLRSPSQAANEPVVNLLTPRPTDDQANFYSIAATATAEPTTSSYFSTEDIHRIRAAAKEAEGWLALCIVSWALIATVFIVSQVAAALLTTRRFHRLAYDRWVVPHLTMSSYTLPNCRHTFIHHNDSGICKRGAHHRNPNSINGSLEQSHLYTNGFTSLPVRTLIQIRRHEEINAGWDAATTKSPEEELEMAFLGGSDKQRGGISSSSIPFQPNRPIPTKELVLPYLRYIVVAVFFPIGQLDIFDAPSSKMFSKFVSKTRFRHPVWSLFHFSFLIAIVPLTISAIGMQQRLNEYDGIVINAQGLYSGDSSSRQQVHPFTPPTDFTADQTSKCVATYIFTATVQLFSVLVLIGFRPHVVLFVNIVDAAKLFINAILYLNTAVSVAESVARQRESEQRGNQLSDLSTTVSKCLDRIPRPPGCESSDAETLLSWQAEMSSQYGTLRAPPTLPGFLDESQTQFLTHLLIALTITHLCHLLLTKMLLLITTIPVPKVLKRMVAGHDWFDFLIDVDGSDRGVAQSSKQEADLNEFGTTTPPSIMLADALSRTKSSDTNIELLPPTPSSSSSSATTKSLTFSRTTSSTPPATATQKKKGHINNKKNKKGTAATLTKVGASYDSTLSLPSSHITTPVKRSIDDISLDMINASSGLPPRKSSIETLSSMGLRTPLESLPITPATTGGGKVFSVPFPSPPSRNNNDDTSPLFDGKRDEKKRTSSVVSINSTPSKATIKSKNPSHKKSNKDQQKLKSIIATRPSMKTKILEKAAGDGTRYLLPPVLPAPASCATWDYNTRAFPLPDDIVANLDDWQLAQLLPPSSSKGGASLSRKESTISQQRGDSSTRLRGNTMKYDIDWQHGISEHELQEITDRKQAITLPTQDEDDDDLGTFDSLEEAVEDQPHPPQAENNEDKDEEEDPYGGGMSITLANRIKEYKKFSSSLLDEKALPKNNKSQDYTKLSNQRQGIESSSSSSFSASFDESAAATNSRKAPPPTQHQSKRHQPTAFGDGDWI